MLHGKKRRDALHMANLIRLCERFPAFADYAVFDAQPTFWLESIMNLMEAEQLHTEQKSNG